MSTQEWIDSLLAIGPEIGLLVLAIVVLFADRGLHRQRRTLGLITAWGSLIILIATLGLWFFFDQPSAVPVSYWGGMITHDMFSLVFRVIFLIVIMVTSLISLDFKDVQRGEYYALLLTATIGFSLMAASSDLVMLYIALETASLSLYILAGFTKNVYRSTEAGMKYFIYGAFASAVMLYGLSMIYGLTAQTSIYDVAGQIQRSLAFGQFEPAILLAAVMVIVGFSFKISAVPFHFWTPDVYEGAPTPVTGLVSTASKAAGFAVFFRVFVTGVFGPAESTNDWWAMLVAMTVVTMTLGNLLAIRQTNIKRLLAYSSIAQAGYAMIGLVTFTPDSTAATIFFLLYYAISNVAAFAVVILVSNVTGSDEIEDLSGLSRRSPYLALAMLFALLSLGGIPPTAGFFGKFFIFRATIEQGYWLLALVGILNAFVALYYYLSVAKYIYLYRSDEEDVPIPVSRAAMAALGATIFGIIYLGVLANAAYEWTREAANALFAFLG